MLLDRAWLISTDLAQSKKEIAALKQENKLLRKTREKQSKIPSAQKKKEQVGRPLGYARKIAEHYGVARQSVFRILQRAELETSVSPKQRPGRPLQLTPNKRKALTEVFNESKGRASLKVMSNRMIGKTSWKTQRLGNLIHAPSDATLSRSLRDGTWAQHMIRRRPHLDAVAIAERIAFCPEALERDDTRVVCHDEAYVEIGRKNGRVLVDLKALPKGDDGQEEDVKVPVQFDSGGKHEPKVFLFGAVAKPQTIMENGELYIDPLFDGRVLLARIRGSKQRKRGKKGADGHYIAGKKVGDPIFENVTIDGYRYKRICEMPNGLFESIREYLNPALRPRNYSTSRVLCIDTDKEVIEKSQSIVRWNKPALSEAEAICTSQEDGAPGHGYNNRAGGKETQIHETLVYNASTLGIRMVKQSRHSPEFNYLDLGVWYSLKKAVERRSTEIPDYNGKNEQIIEASIWKVVKEEWDALDCTKLFNIAEQRRVLLKKCIEIGGKSIEKEPHTGIRKTTPVKHRREPELEEEEQPLFWDA
jgi:transposase